MKTLPNLVEINDFDFNFDIEIAVDFDINFDFVIKFYVLRAPNQLVIKTEYCILHKIILL